MAVTATPAFTQSLLLSQVQATVANSNRDGSTGTYSSAISAGANGSVIDYIVFVSTGTTAAGLVRIFFSPDSGTTWRLFDEVITSAVTPSGTLPASRAVWIPPGGVPWKIPVNGQVRFNVHNSETWNCLVHGENL